MRSELEQNLRLVNDLEIGDSKNNERQQRTFVGLQLLLSINPFKRIEVEMKKQHKHIPIKRFAIGAFTLATMISLPLTAGAIEAQSSACSKGLEGKSTNTTGYCGECITEIGNPGLLVFGGTLCQACS